MDDKISKIKSSHTLNINKITDQLQAEENLPAAAIGEELSRLEWDLKRFREGREEIMINLMLSQIKLLNSDPIKYCTKEIKFNQEAIENIEASEAEEDVKLERKAEFVEEIEKWERIKAALEAADETPQPEEVEETGSETDEEARTIVRPRRETKDTTPPAAVTEAPAEPQPKIVIDDQEMQRAHAVEKEGISIVVGGRIYYKGAVCDIAGMSGDGTATGSKYWLRPVEGGESFAVAEVDLQAELQNGQATLITPGEDLKLKREAKEQYDRTVRKFFGGNEESIEAEDMTEQEKWKREIDATEEVIKKTTEFSNANTQWPGMLTDQEKLSIHEITDLKRALLGAGLKMELNTQPIDFSKHNLSQLHEARRILESHQKQYGKRPNKELQLYIEQVDKFVDEKQRELAEIENQERIITEQLEQLRERKRARAEAARLEEEKARTETIPNDSIENTIIELLKPFKKIDKIEKVEVTAESNKIFIYIKVISDKGKEIVIRADIENNNEKFEAKNLDIEAGTLTQLYLNSKIKPELAKIEIMLKNEVEKQKGKEVEKLWFEDGLKVRYKKVS